MQDVGNPELDFPKPVEEERVMLRGTRVNLEKIRRALLEAAPAFDGNCQPSAGPQINQPPRWTGDVDKIPGWGLCPAARLFQSVLTPNTNNWPKTGNSSIH